MHRTTYDSIRLNDRADTPLTERRAFSPLLRVTFIALWILGFVTLMIWSVIIRNHPAPYPFEYQFTLMIQNAQLWGWVDPLIRFFSNLDNTLPAVTGITLCVFALAFIRWSEQRKEERRYGANARPRGFREHAEWYRQPIFLAVGTAIGSLLNLAITILVARPRPLGPICGHPHALTAICVTDSIPIHSFPSGHCEFDMMLYGFLLYLSFTRAVQEWRYHWLLLPLQLFAAAAILIIGYSRVLEGDHWLLDVGGGYLSGALWLTLSIFLYRKVRRGAEARWGRKIALSGS
ncbi:MAG TPA: phosphatase PAP2 family protein [Ktedonobacteraceae bacterium]|nr:phosphatase PAP2 family protein [Ktedonobacteraceae bacterium]